MKRTIAHFIFAVCVAGLVRADQTTQSVQQALKDQGFYYGNVTGDKSAETTAAIRRYQIRNGLPVTGELNPETLGAVKSSNSTSSSQAVSKPAATAAAGALADESSRVSQKSPPPSLNEPNRGVDMNAALAGGYYQSVPRRPDRHMLAEVQHQLMIRGYYQGRVDGRYGRRTSFAVRAFQLSSGLPPTGHVDAGTLNALGVSSDNFASSNAAPRSSETWVPVTKFKHGKWKVKWKKNSYRDGVYREADRQENGDAYWDSADRDD